MAPLIQITFGFSTLILFHSVWAGIKPRLLETLSSGQSFTYSVFTKQAIKLTATDKRSTAFLSKCSNALMLHAWLELGAPVALSYAYYGAPTKIETVFCQNLNTSSTVDVTRYKCVVYVVYWQDQQVAIVSFTFVSDVLKFMSKRQHCSMPDPLLVTDFDLISVTPVFSLLFVTSWCLHACTGVEYSACDLAVKKMILKSQCSSKQDSIMLPEWLKNWTWCATRQLPHTHTRWSRANRSTTARSLWNLILKLQKSVAFMYPLGSWFPFLAAGSLSVIVCCIW